MSDAHAEKAARREPVERLRGLETGAQGIRPRIPERCQPAHSIRLEQGHGDEGKAQAAGEKDDVPEPAASRPVGAEEDAHGHDRCPEIPLEHQKHEDPRQHRDEGNEHVLEVAHPLGVAVDPVRDEN